MANNPRVFLDIAVNFKTVGRIVIELFADTNPATAENFRALCTGEKGIGESGIPLHYKGSIIHSVNPGMMWLGGDITHGNGLRGESIYESIYGRDHQVTDSKFLRKHDRKGILSTLNLDEYVIGSQFMLLLTEFPTLDGYQFAFGQVVQGFDVISQVEQMVGDDLRYPFQPLTIADCGQLDEGGSISTMVGCSVPEHVHKMLKQLRAWQLKTAEMETILAMQTISYERGNRNFEIKESLALHKLFMVPCIQHSVPPESGGEGSSGPEEHSVAHAKEEEGDGLV
ncbi:Peptidyl-prolyl cis-trans isomerase [Raphanus sativus]|uniref:Peptidyl-prolyl cis-trans isomerase n=1 Tax=Raphanus sativus TaxID=3726 RepID=A0A6J0MU61_RAPSA|nr:peptidyl-prolyl cis-trans isomerase CYP19-1 [Raphanus sativus]KAJ4915240.1 Peptidyl-prolyl cis-trans isomerase [Raphanus sativus]